VPAVGAASIQDSLGTSHQGVALGLLSGPLLLALVLEPVLFVLADRYPRKIFICGGLFAMAGAAFVAAWAPGPIALGLTLGVAYVASGCGATLAEATLVDARPHERERTMTRWSMMGMVGDLAAPALMAAVAWAALGWRHAFVVVGIAVGLWALALTRVGFPVPATSAEPPTAIAGPGDGAGIADSAIAVTDPPPRRASLRSALRPRLLLWLLAATFCDLLDEILVVFASIHLRDALGAGAGARSVVLAAFVAGSAAGLAITDRLLQRMAALRVLALSSLLCAGLYLAWLAAPTVGLSAVLMIGVGATAAPLYPIAAAQAYAALPGRSGTVHAIGHLFTPLSMAFPLALGWIADQASPAAALLVLVAQPVVVGALAVGTMRARTPP
jgi:MFS family permease